MGRTNFKSFLASDSFIGTSSLFARKEALEGGNVSEVKMPAPISSQWPKCRKADFLNGKIVGLLLSLKTSIHEERVDD